MLCQAGIPDPASEPAPSASFARRGMFMAPKRIKLTENDRIKTADVLFFTGIFDILLLVLGYSNAQGRKDGETTQIISVSVFFSC
jgi:hypothetical protein